jgi:hypothetical protein
MIKRFWSRLQTLWCRLMHPAAMWPSGGYYRCSTCLRTYPVPWARSEDAPAGQPNVSLGSFCVPQVAFAENRRRN